MSLPGFHTLPLVLFLVSHRISFICNHYHINLLCCIQYCFHGFTVAFSKSLKGQLSSILTWHLAHCIRTVAAHLRSQWEKKNECFSLQSCSTSRKRLHNQSSERKTFENIILKCYWLYALYSYSIYKCEGENEMLKSIKYVWFCSVIGIIRYVIV